MDITLLKTFLEVSRAGSFADAAEQLFVTQSAVSLRIQRLEASLGQTLFHRSKAGALLTPQGTEFEAYALSMLRTWEEARQQIAIPDNFDSSLTIGAQYSLWPRLGFQLIDEIRSVAPRVSLRAELGMPDRLTRFLVEGVTQVALLYTPTLRPGLQARQVFEDDLVLVAAWPGATLDSLAGRYVFVDWGPEFVHAHAGSMAELINPGLTLALGALSGEFIMRRGLAGYLPARSVRRYLASGALHLVPGAPTFPYPAWMVWRESLSSGMIDVVDRAMQAVLTRLDEEADDVFDQLKSLNHGEIPQVLGD